MHTDNLWDFLNLGIFKQEGEFFKENIILHGEFLRV